MNRAVPGTILERIVDDHRDADLLAASGRLVPSKFLRQFGFLSDELAPIARITTRTTQVTYPLADDGATSGPSADSP
ncbi:hypothetical protein [Natrarchaeobius oligotrophus]|uniref:Uncharacterized protein n=1 Tax=Natrarchaeobius chitinivorans TaxID=1679083 RepID=A0A3N6MZ40_NATCH|nr:hypothetical protein [Natrarchaeobius chitinivorans]RQH00367.1 hypothetical protein EA472_10980 [Natrarchaeobius chitinivorans]